jgi:hypothetical protein
MDKNFRMNQEYFHTRYNEKFQNILPFSTYNNDNTQYIIPCISIHAYEFIDVAIGYLAAPRMQQDQNQLMQVWLSNISMKW